MLFPAVHESRDEPADVPVREPPRGGWNEPDVQVERVGRVGVPEKRRHRLDVLASGEVDGRERVSEGVGPRAGEPRFPDERVPSLLERVVAPGVARFAQKRRRAPKDEPHLVEPRLFSSIHASTTDAVYLSSGTVRIELSDLV